MSSEKMFAGQCHCGQFKITFKGDPNHAAYCHCGDCRQITGAPVSMLLGLGPDQIIEKEGELSVYQSSENVTRSFCPQCGSSIDYHDQRLPDVYYHVGLFEAANELKPAMHAYMDSRISWFEVKDELPKFEQTSRPR